MPKISSSSNTILPDRSEFLHLVATWFGLGYLIAKKFRAAVFNQCRQEEEEEEEEENSVLTYFCSKFYTCPASNLQKTRSSKLVSHSKHTCGRRQKALLRRERERERTGGRFASSFFSRRQLLHSDVMITGPSVFFESSLFCRAPGYSRSRSECSQLITPPRKYCRESYSTQNKQNHNLATLSSGPKDRNERERETRRETQTERKRDMNKLGNATNRRR
jgi:hypothetical protein